MAAIHDEYTLEQYGYYRMEWILDLIDDVDHGQILFLFDFHFVAKHVEEYVPRIFRFKQTQLQINCIVD